MWKFVKRSRVSNGEEDESAGTRNEVSDNNPCAPSTSEAELKKLDFTISICQWVSRGVVILIAL